MRVGGGGGRNSTALPVPGVVSVLPWLASSQRWLRWSWLWHLPFPPLSLSPSLPLFLFPPTLATSLSRMSTAGICSRCRTRPRVLPLTESFLTSATPSSCRCVSRARVCNSAPVGPAITVCVAWCCVQKSPPPHPRPVGVLQGLALYCLRPPCGTSTPSPVATPVEVGGRDQDSADWTCFGHDAQHTARWCHLPPDPHPCPRAPCFPFPTSAVCLGRCWPWVAMSSRLFTLPLARVCAHPVGHPVWSLRAALSAPGQWVMQ